MERCDNAAYKVIGSPITCIEWCDNAVDQVIGSSTIDSPGTCIELCDDAINCLLQGQFRSRCE